MAKTPYIDIKSEDILSAHISGLQHSVNKIETVLDMKTATKTAYALTPVTDQQDATLHRFVYECAFRNWLSLPAPVIYRNGVVVSTDEYDLKAAQGAIVFHVQQGIEHNITADFTHLIDQSTTIETINTNIAGLDTRITATEGNITTNANAISALDIRVDTLEASNGTSTPDSTGVFDLLGTGAHYADIFSNWRPDIPGSINPSFQTAASILMANSVIDAIPMILKQAITITQLRIILNSASATGDHILGIYSNKVNDIAPDALLAETAIFTHTTGTTTTHTKPLLSSITLQPGIYWLARYHKNHQARVDGHNFLSTHQISIVPPSTAVSNIPASPYPIGVAQGVRTQAILDLLALPATFPVVGSGASDARYLIRDQVGTIYALK